MRASIGWLVITFENIVCGHDKESYKTEKLQQRRRFWVVDGGRSKVEKNTNANLILTTTPLDQ